MNNFERLKKANPEKFEEFIYEGVTFWVKDPMKKPATARNKLKELNLLDRAESGTKNSENIPFLNWIYIASLYEKKEDGTFVRMFSDDQVEQAYEDVTNDFIAALDKVLIKLRGLDTKTVDEKNAATSES